MAKTQKEIKPEIIKGYKVTDSNMRCRGYQYELDKEYEHKGNLEMCGSGFHFCKQANDCFQYYDFNSSNRVFEVEASGDVLHGDDKSVCSRIKIIREYTWHEVLELVNIGKHNTGRGNTGDRNTGDRNTGYSNTGDRNTGDWNTGYRNTGDRNTGYRNTGDWNTGDRNTGYSNTGDHNTGIFCTGKTTIELFNKPSEWTLKDFQNSKAFELMRRDVDTKLWIPENRMTDEEKEKFPAYKTADGYVKDIPFKEAFINAWHNWNANARKEFTSLPNFDAAIFFEITGVKID
jgi:hypothetical protein